MIAWWYSEYDLLGGGLLEDSDSDESKSELVNDKSPKSPKFSIASSLPSCTVQDFFKHPIDDGKKLPKNLQSSKRKRVTPPQEEKHDLRQSSEGGKKNLNILTATGEDFAVTGSRVDEAEVYAAADFHRCQEVEMKNLLENAKEYPLESFQLLGHKDDVSKEIVRCPACPFHHVSVNNANTKKKWRNLIIEHPKSP